MGRKLDGIVDGYRIAFIPREKIKGNMGSRIHGNLYEKDSEYKGGSLNGYRLAGITMLGGCVVVASGLYIGMSLLVAYLSN